MQLSEFFALHPKAAIGFSGGADSAFLLDQAVKAKADVAAYYVQTAFQPAFELADARAFAAGLSIPLRVISLDILADERVSQNDAMRCYYCKKRIFGAIAEQAQKDGYSLLLDGTNASDDISDRPGYMALQELSVLSPLRICGITKEELRRESARLGLVTAKKPAYACLATRIWDQPVTKEALEKAENAERLLMLCGYRDFRVRCKGKEALLQIALPQYERAKEELAALQRELAPLFDTVTLDVPRNGEKTLWM